MKEPVRRAEHPLLVGAVVVAVSVAFFTLMANSGYRDPAPALSYSQDLSSFREQDNVESPFEETDRIVLDDLPGLRAMATGADGTIYIGADNTVALYDAEGTLLKTHEIEGSPVSLGVAPDGTIYVGMDQNGDIESHVVAIAPDGSTTAWASRGPKAYLTSVVADAENVYVADMGNRVVVRYNRDGEELLRIGQKDPERDVPGLVAPSPYLDLGFDDMGNLWVVNPGRLGLERYRENGDFVTSWYNPSMKLDGFSGCCNPSHIAFTKEGKLITAEKGLVRLKVYDVTTGEFEELVAGTDLFPREQSVHDLAVDVNDRILVLDPRHNAVRIFERTEEGNESTTQPA